MEGGAAASTPAALPYYVAFSQLLGLTLVAMTGAWLGLYRGGIAWESDLQFNAHPLCMVIGLVFLQGDALLVYRVFRNEAKRTTKVLHGLLHVFALVIALVGLVAVFDYHRKKGYADLYSLHSWCGILVFVLYFVQWLVGFGFFLFPGAPFSLRSRYRPQHIFFGATIFLLSVGTALLGLKEALLFNLGPRTALVERGEKPRTSDSLSPGGWRQAFSQAAPDVGVGNRGHLAAPSCWGSLLAAPPLQLSSGFLSQAHPGSAQAGRQRAQTVEFFK
ncbi:transmembrane ascorbate-dependent reductase CYB561 isoform X1 [Chlorocebus sabaeus]|uniref:transmembrane ascorbate-dependent reductase CYB561 isoform X1 n=1 Tax=Chlorocebus sabaeus TaxID=60711 RepID=UPI0018B0E506|nr:cytochrome b561 isoform X4 [Chlorocebus sabaeus]XP_008010368.2 cytochrome b561 isoform X4 [Chlorocebus sabaeus]XP_008010369.2 cytochrome b561 isoform X4 [Chlorocebus sabaeus]